MATILVIEDEKDLQKVLDYNLRQAGHQVWIASRGRDGLRLAMQHRPDVILLDLMLPDIPGTDVCRSLRAAPETSAVRILILTARGEEIDRIIGFELGADDYVVKPFSVRELLLRIQAVLRRGGPQTPASAVVRFGSLRLDRESHRTWVGDEEVELTALEFRLLLTLHDRGNRVLTREKLLDDVWGIGYVTNSVDHPTATSCPSRR
jgi:two-component system phosphate regulon response regulator PhoB